MTLRNVRQAVGRVSGESASDGGTVGVTRSGASVTPVLATLFSGPVLGRLESEPHVLVTNVAQHFPDRTNIKYT